MVYFQVIKLNYYFNCDAVKLVKFATWFRKVKAKNLALSSSGTVPVFTSHAVCSIMGRDTPGP